MLYEVITSYRQGLFHRLADLAHGAGRYLAVLARANRADCERLVVNLGEANSVGRNNFV